jgi:glucans biosynthesis protein
MSIFDRRTLIAAAGAALCLPRALAAAPAAQPFAWSALVTMAQRLARQPFAETPPNRQAARIDYDALNRARFKAARTLWGDLPGDVAIRFFPLSANAAQPVYIAIVEKGLARPLRYDPTMFEGDAVPALGPDAGFAGFRVMNAARDADWLSFLGASYFRAAGAEKQFGLSARAVSIDTSLPGKEQFPRFTRFWLERTGSSELTVHALLDGAALTGAFRFVNRLTSKGVVQDVTASLFPRRAIEELGLMPMTSMFWYDQSGRPHGGDWRPEVHDSDMLAFAGADGTPHARPLVNPVAPRFSLFEEVSPRSFGLLQRDRAFDHYQDDGVFYERRPSLWATPSAPLGAGAVRLYEFPTDSEYVDNVVAYWTPAAQPRPGTRIDAAYRLDWSSARTPGVEGQAHVANIWRGPSGEAGIERLVVDFVGVPSTVKPDIWTDVSGGAIVKTAGYAIQGQPGQFRTVLDVRRAGGALAEIRLQLRTSHRAFSEYVHYPLGA